MNQQRPLWMSEEGEGTGDSIERLVVNQDWKAIAGLLEDGDSIPQRVLPNRDATALPAFHVAQYLIKRGLHLQPDGSDYWYVEHLRAARPLQTRRRAGEFKAVG